jgi:hypothetical protein
VEASEGEEEAAFEQYGGPHARESCSFPPIEGIQAKGSGPAEPSSDLPACPGASPLATACRLPTAVLLANGSHDGVERPNQGRTRFAEVGDAVAYQAIEEPLSSRSHAEQHASLVLLGPLAPKQAASLHPVYQLDGTVMADLEAFGQAANRGLLAGGKSPQVQQTDVLLWFEADGTGGSFGIVQIAADQEADIGKGLILKQIRNATHGFSRVSKNVNAVHSEWTMYRPSGFQLLSQNVFSESTRIVTGPSFTSSTSMRA